jgi:hypothetical protein
VNLTVIEPATAEVPASIPEGDALGAESEALAVLEARSEMGMVVDTFRFYAGAPERKALRVARAVETGGPSINSNRSVRGRELGPHAADASTEMKTVYYATGG